MEGDMKDPELNFWCTYPNTFLVATSLENDNVVLGFVGCKKVSETTMELNRLTVLPEAR